MTLCVEGIGFVMILSTLEHVGTLKPELKLSLRVDIIVYICHNYDVHMHP